MTRASPVNVEGTQSPKILKAGNSFLIPNGTIHGVKDVGNGNAAELATYIVEKGIPVVRLAK